MDNTSDLANYKSAKIPISTAFNIRTIHTDSGLVSSVVNSPKMLNYMGGNNAIIVTPDADVKMTVMGAW